MNNVWHTIWDSAQGPIKRLAPQTRIICGASTAAICLIAPALRVSGIITAIAALSIWVTLSRPPWYIIRKTLLFAMVLFLPYFLLTPLIMYESRRMDWLSALSAPWSVFFHGTSMMFATVFVATTLSLSALRQGLQQLPIPSIISTILIQIIHQTAGLYHETIRMAHAVSVRCGTKGYRTAVRIIISLPTAWMPRVVDRAERVADAMTLRGYCQHDLSDYGKVPYSAMDILAIVSSICCISAVTIIRVRGI